MLFIILGVAVYALLKFIPWLGAPLLIIMDLFAIGIGVGYFLHAEKSAILEPV